RHMREGVVVRPVAERESPGLGRVILKSVSGDYLTRKGGTEYN
ncbi:MAG: RNA ligase (ATP), partial [Gammaproteobacteria bacterium]|nr:RNA ligase (ATP) [Gammaproteobacteria bacterium]